MTTEISDYSKQISDLVTTFQNQCSDAVKDTSDLRTNESMSVLNSTLDVLTGLCGDIRKANKVTKTVQVNFSIQVECIGDVLANMEALEAHQFGSKSAVYSTAIANLKSADEALEIGLQSLDKSITGNVSEGFSNDDTSTNGATALLETIEQNYWAGAEAIFSDAKTTFRPDENTKNIKTALSKLKDECKKLDASPINVSDVEAISSSINGLVKEVQAQLVKAESADITCIQSAKYATLDQPKLKPYAALLKDVDKGLVDALNFVTAKTSVDPGDASELDATVEAAAKLNTPNTPASIDK